MTLNEWRHEPTLVHTVGPMRFTWTRGESEIQVRRAGHRDPIARLDVPPDTAWRTPILAVHAARWLKDAGW